MSVPGASVPGMEDDDDLGKLATTAVEFANSHSMTIVPAVPEPDSGVSLTEHDLDLPEFLELARKLGDGALYLGTRYFTVDPDTDEAQDIPALLAGRTGHLVDLRIALASAGHGLVHFWEKSEPWYQELLDSQDDEDDEAPGLRTMLDEEERERLAGEVADVILADPEFRAASPADRRRRARLLIPEGTEQHARWDGAHLALERVQDLTEQAYQPLKEQLSDLAAEFLASPGWQEAASPAARKQAAVQFLIPRADGFFPPPVIRDELYARAKRLSKNSGGSGLF
jgi:hypothetical protein